MVDLINPLQDHGADTEALDQKLRTPLDVATEQNQDEVVALLVDAVT